MIIQDERKTPTTDTHEGKDAPEDWRQKIVQCLKNPGEVKDQKLRWRSLKYTILDDKLYRRTIDGLLLKCLSEEQAKVAM
jgi:hypothetical protein